MLRTLPFISLLIFIIFFAIAFNNKTDFKVFSQPNMINNSIPEFSLKSSLPGEKGFGRKDLLGKYTLVNVFASWCSSCIIEHPMLIELQKAGVDIYGLNWRDSERVIFWLKENGNPYKRVGNDHDGAAAVAFGISGAPESFLINPEGVIIFHLREPINEENKEKILSLIKDKK